MSIDDLHGMVSASLVKVKDFPDFEHDGYVDIKALAKDTAVAKNMADFREFLAKNHLIVKTDEGVFEISDFNGLKFTVKTNNDHDDIQFWQITSFIRENATLHVSPKNGGSH